MVIIQYLLISGWISGILMVFMNNQLLIIKFNTVQTSMVATAEIYIHIVIAMNKKLRMKDKPKLISLTKKLLTGGTDHE